MVPIVYSKIIQKLSKQTKRGKVDWKPTSTPDKFLVSFKEFSLAIWNYSEQNVAEHGTAFELIDSSGKVIDQFYVDDSDHDWGLVAGEIFAGARRKALKIDEALKIISKELSVDEEGDQENDQESDEEPPF